MLFSGSYEYLWGVTGFASATIGFKIIGLITVFVAAMYIFRGVTSLFVHGPNDVLASFRTPCFNATQAIRPSFVNGLIIDGALLVVQHSSWVVVMTLVLELVCKLPCTGIDVPKYLYKRWQDRLRVDFQVGFWSLLEWLHCRMGLCPFNADSTSTGGQQGRNMGKTWWYVLFWNKWYFDEIYDAYIVNPTIQLARWLWLIIDIRM